MPLIAAVRRRTRLLSLVSRRHAAAQAQAVVERSLAKCGREQGKREEEGGGTRSRRRALLHDLKVCSSTRDLGRGKEIHAEAMETGNGSCVYVAAALVNMYAKCGSMVDARRVFEGIEQPDVVLWTALILGYVDNGEATTALDLYAGMRSRGCQPNSFTFVAALKACTCLAQKQDGSRRDECLQRGKAIHSAVGRHTDHFVQSALIDMYSKCGSMADARQVFDGAQHPDAVSWNALVAGYAENGEGNTALDLFQRMKSRGCAPNSFTFVAALKACASLAAKQDGAKRAECLERGRQIHGEIGGRSDLYVQNSLVDMYGKCGSMIDARRVFDRIQRPDVVSWTSLILGYADNGEEETALHLFARMKSQGCAPNSLTFVAALRACSCLALKQDAAGKAECLERGRRIHSQIGTHTDMYVRNTLIEMYSNCGSMVDSRRVFDCIQQPGVVAWTTIISAYAENGKGAVALELFSRMRSQGCAPDFITFVAAIKACSSLGALECGRKIHAEVGTGTTELNVVVANCLVDFYAKCGCLVEAQSVFDCQATTRNLITWNTLLAGYSRLGDSGSVFGLFKGMQDAGFRPDAVTFLCLLTCCSHAGLVEKAGECFEAMWTKYGIAPSVEHYTCMVDMLGRSNNVEQASALVESMPCRPNAVTWMTLLAACRKWKNVEIGRLAFKALVGLDESNAPAYVLMAHIYGSRSMWEEQKTVLQMRRNFKAWKEPGQSCWTNEAGQVHTFLVGDSKHPQIQEIQVKLKSMFEAMKEQGYAADLLSVSQNLSDAKKEEALCGHSEKLALACALINTQPGETIRIVKNLRVCDDCHSVAALVSKLEHRTILCRDASRFHVFQDGKCSCGDFW